MPEVLKKILSSRKALMTLLALGLLFGGVYLGKVPWDTDTRNLFMQIAMLWLGAQTIEDVALKPRVGGKAPSPLQTVVQAVVNTEKRDSLLPSVDVPPSAPSPPPEAQRPSQATLQAMAPTPREIPTAPKAKFFPEPSTVDKVVITPDPARTPTVASRPIPPPLPPQKKLPSTA